MMTDFQNFKWLLWFVFFIPEAALSSSPTHSLKKADLKQSALDRSVPPPHGLREADLPGTPNSVRILSSKSAKGKPPSASQKRNSANISPLHDKTPPSAAKISPRLGPISGISKDFPKERQTPFLGPIPTDLRQNILMRDPYISAELPEELKDLPPENGLPSLGQIPEKLKQILREREPHITGELTEKLHQSGLKLEVFQEGNTPETPSQAGIKDASTEETPPSFSRPGNVPETSSQAGIKDASTEETPPSFSRPGNVPETPSQAGIKDASAEETPPSLLKHINVPEALMLTREHNKEVQVMALLLMQAVEKENSEHYRILIKYALMSYSPIQVLSILHFVREKSENSLIHLLAKTSSEQLIYELKSLMEVFLPFVKNRGFFKEIRAPLPLEKFRKTAPEESEDGNLWAVDTPIDMESMALAQALQKENPPAYHKELISELLKPGNMRRLLAALHGNTLTGKSLYDFLEEAQSNNPEFFKEAESLAKWFTPPLYRTNRAGKTPLLIAQKVFKRTGRSEAFVILSTAETGFGIAAENQGKKPQKKTWRKTTALFAKGVGCLSSFKNMK